jgi:hypothetical protein
MYVQVWWWLIFLLLLIIMPTVRDITPPLHPPTHPTATTKHNQASAFACPIAEATNNNFLISWTLSCSHSLRADACQSYHIILVNS